MQNEFQNGALVDVRPEEKKRKDFYVKEVFASANPVNWVEKTRAEWRTFPDQDQDGSGSCVAQTVKKIATVLLWLKEKTSVVFSATPIYQARSNKPMPGMLGVEAFDAWKNNGITLESLVSSSQMNDAQMDAAIVEQYEKDIAKVFQIGGHIGITEGDFETVASVIQTTGKAVMTWFYFTTEEWSREIPVIIDPSLKLVDALRHSVAAVDCFCFAGKKFLLIEDSAHFGGLTRRLISEDFFKARNWFVRYPMNFTFDVQPVEKPKPQHFFLTDLEFDMTNDEVKALQDVLRYEGLFPTNSQSTGYFGAITLKAVQGFQTKYGVIVPGEPGYGRVGPKTRAKLNELYG